MLRVDSWAGADRYERYVGRWSRAVAAELVDRLEVPPGLRWLDVGCGTGALTSAVLAAASPSHVFGIDATADFVRHAAGTTQDPRVLFGVADAQALPVRDGGVDTVVSGLVLNFVPDRARALAEMRRVVATGGLVAVYVWDYPGEMQLMKHFWETAAELDPAASAVDEARRFAFCNPESLAEMFATAGFDDVHVDAIVVPTVFEDFDDYWSPFLAGQAPAPSYVASLSVEQRAALEAALAARLPVSAGGSIRLTARAWAVVSRG
jgi:ubiquinone/menaquinone biosynthesis C-methylase UbiE